MEVWKDIVAEMREVSGDETVNEIVITKRDWLTMADRIEAACKTLEKAYNNAVSADARHCLENEKLLRALKPVMKCDVSFDETAWMADQLDAEQMYAVDRLCDAVREAQAILKGDVK